VDEAYDTAEDLLMRNRALVEKLAKDLIEYETVDAKHLKRLVDEHAVDRPPSLEKFDRDYNSSYQQD
jgi:cell division protease FtsH